MGRIRWLATFLIVLPIWLGLNAAVVSAALAAAWPAEREFLLVEPPVPNHLYPPPSSVAEAPDRALLVLVYWPGTATSDDGSVTEWPGTRLVRIALDGSRAFIPPIGELAPGSLGMRTDADEIVPLPDGSILFSRSGALDLRHRDGSILRVAGTGRVGFSGDGGPATAAEIGVVRGLTRFADGSVVFGDDHRVRRIAPDGAITTIAGTGEFGFGGDGGQATAAVLRFPSDVLPEGNGGFLIADAYNGRIRQVSPDGVISTVVGTGSTEVSFGDGGPATAAGLVLPQHLGRLPDGTLLIGESQRIRQVSTDGTIRTIFELPERRAHRLGDFAGRYADTIEAMDVTEEGGIMAILSGFHLRAVYLAPPRTRRTLVAIRDVRVSPQHVKVTVDTTAPGSLRLEVRRLGKLVAQAARRVKAGRQVLAVSRRFTAAYHDVRVTLRAERGGSYRDHVGLFTSARLPERLVVATLDGYAPRCKRIDGRRIDCESHDPADEESGLPCLHTGAYRLFASGLVFTRPYGSSCHSTPIPFEPKPNWTGPWRAWPPR
jgi:hypothetical protein